jgi:cellobiose phosphorylase
LWGGGDWNDSFDGAGLKMIGESVWLSIAAVKATKDFIELLHYLGDDTAAAKYAAANDKMINNIHYHGWDKDHYIYGINDWREKVGTYDTADAQIFLNPQTWAVIAGVAEDEQALLNLVEDRLKCDFGYVQCTPSYSKPDPHVGRISYFGKGLFENGSVYNHGCAFKMVADCIAGRGNNAYKTLKLMSPYNPKNPYEHSGVEPYVTTNMYLGPECKLRAGEVTGSWTTGTTSWVFRTIVEYMLGIRAEFNGLRIEPQLPDGWDEVTAVRTFRGAVYRITIEKNGKKEIYLDGKKLEGSIVPICEKGTKHDVTVRI